MVEWSELLAAARKAQAAAYAPYSNYQVGSAILADGQVFSGCNVENASYGATVCAERNAIGAMILAGAKHIERVVVVTPSKSPKTPCGVCRQVLAEFHHHGDFEILSVGSEGAEQCILFSDLHPQGFGPKDLVD